MPRRRRVVIVGAGAAGCVVAGSLVADGRFDVTLVEAGPDRDTTDRSQAVNSADLFVAATSIRHVVDAPVIRANSHGSTGSGRDGTVQYYRRGVGIGGSGAINGLVLHRGTPATFDRWGATAGCSGWDSAALWPIVTRRFQRGRVVPPLEWGIVDRIVAGRAPTPSDVRLAVDEQGLRACSASTDLYPVRTSPRLTVRSDLAVVAVAMDQGSDRSAAIGVHLHDGSTMPADFVILSAGALGSPALLHQSGIDRPGIGRGLHDHHGVSVNVALPADDAERAPWVTGVACSFEGTSSMTQLLALNRSDANAPAELGRRNGAIFAGVADLRTRGHLEFTARSTATRSARHSARSTTIGSTTIGSTTIATHSTSGEPVAASLPTLHFDLPHPHDRARLRDAALLLRSFLFNAELSALSPNDHEGLDRWVDANRAEYLHAAGTCVMGGPNDDDAVVNNACQVIGTSGLYVVDASIFPTSLSPNPYLATIAMAELAADRIASFEG